jgi:hypothetical protein
MPSTMFIGVLGYVADFGELRSIATRVVDAVPAGSYPALWDGTDTSETVRAGSAKLAESGAVPYNLGSLEQLRQCFEGLEMVDPGLVSIPHWRPETVSVGRVEPIDGHEAVARKP